MTDLVKIYLKHNKNFVIPKCVNKKCLCFPKSEQTVTYRKDEPLSYVVQVQSVVKKYKKNYDCHFNMSSLRLGKYGKIKGHILEDIIRDHFTTLSFFQDYLANLLDKCSSLTGTPYLHYLKNILKRGSYIKKQMKVLLRLFQEINTCKMYSKIRFDLLIYFHLHTTAIFKKSIIQFECP